MAYEVPHLADQRQTPAAVVPHAAAGSIVHSLARGLRVVRYRANVVIATTGLALALGVIYYATATRMYRASASLLVLQTSEDTSTLASQDARDGLLPTYEKLLTSEVVLSGAIQQLEKLPPEFRIDLPADKRSEWGEILRDNLQVNFVRRTSIIDVSYRSRAPRAAVAVVDAVVESYLDFMDKNHKHVSAEILTVLKKEQEEVYDRLTAEKKQLMQAQVRSRDLGLNHNPGVVHPVVERALRLNKSLLETQDQRLKLEASLAAIRTAMASGSDLRQHLLTLEPMVGQQMMLAAMGFDTAGVQMMSRVEQQLVDDRAELNTLTQHYGPNHPKVRDVSDRIGAAQQYLRDYQGKVAQRVNDLHGAQLGQMLIGMVREGLAKTMQLENRLTAEYNAAEQQAIALHGQMAELAVIDQDITMLRNLYEALTNRIANLEVDYDQAEVQVSRIKHPVENPQPVSPRLAMVFVLALACGAGLGLGLVYVLDALDDRFRSPEELGEQLATPVLALIRKLPERDGLGIETLQVSVAPDAVESEAFRTLRTTLAFAGSPLTRLVISSAEPGDGKTTVLANLGLSYAQAGKKTLIIDGDLRRPGLTNLFGMRAVGGLSEILKSHEPIDEQAVARIRATGYDGFDILPCGPRPKDPSELLAGPRMGELIAWAETIYDQILIDSPPALAASDAALIGHLADGVMLVVQPAKNNRRGVIRAVESLRGLGIHLIGAVVNKIDASAGGYYGYGSPYGDGYGYGGYGELDEDEFPPSREALPPLPTLRPRPDDVAGDELIPRRVA